MKEVTGNLIAADEIAIGHGVNTKGLMGAGVAKAIRTAYPDVSVPYIEWCQTAKGGDVQIVNISATRMVVNIASQELPGANAEYEWLTQGLFTAARKLIDLDVYKLALPRIGSGIGGLHWEAVKIIIGLTEFCLKAEFGFPFEFVIYTPEAL